MDPAVLAAQQFEDALLGSVLAALLAVAVVVAYVAAEWRASAPSRQARRDKADVLPFPSRPGMEPGRRSNVSSWKGDCA